MFTINSYGVQQTVTTFTLTSYGKHIRNVTFTVKSYGKHLSHLAANILIIRDTSNYFRRNLPNFLQQVLSFYANLKRKP